MNELIRILAQRIQQQPAARGCIGFDLSYDACLRFGRNFKCLKPGLEIQVGRHMYVLTHRLHDEYARTMHFAFTRAMTWPIVEAVEHTAEHLIAYRPSPVGAGISRAVEGRRGLLRWVSRAMTPQSPRFRHLRFWASSWAEARRGWKAQ